MTPDPPRYQPPPEDPALAILTQQNQQQQASVIQDRTTAASAQLMQMYGARRALSGNATNAPLAMMPMPRATGA